MAFEPRPGLVIRYDFLWKEEDLAGLRDGRKDRPCAIILATKPKDDGLRDVILCPITHSPPKEGESAVEIPYKMARHLKLDDDYVAGLKRIRSIPLNGAQITCLMALCPRAKDNGCLVNCIMR